MRAIDKLSRLTGMTEVEILVEVYKAEHEDVLDWGFLVFLINYRNTGKLSKYGREFLSRYIKSLK